MNREKSVFEGWYLFWILTRLMETSLRLDKIEFAHDLVGLLKVYCANEYKWNTDEDGDVQIDMFHSLSEKSLYSFFIHVSDWVDSKDCVDTNFKNTLMIVRKGWVTKVE